jgi:homocysteine S-methyltransferase
MIRQRPILLDGATGTELGRRAVDIRAPLWSARALLSAPDVLRQIHSDYLRAGAEIITANTFRTHRRNLAKEGLGERAAELTRFAVDVARTAIQQMPVGAPQFSRYVAGSIAPLEDCYSPALVPPQETCEHEHAEMARHLAQSGVDLILIETMNTIREAKAASKVALRTGLPVFTSFVCRSDGRLLSGETITEAAQVMAPLGVAGLLINCTPAFTIHEPFKELRAAVQAMAAPVQVLGLYANVGHIDNLDAWTNTADVSPLEYAKLVSQTWLTNGAKLVGGCCGTTPAHIAAVRMALTN